MARYARYDKTIDAAVKAQEEKTKKKAPYFGASSRDKALKLPAWKDIGKVWKRAPMTCWQAYIEHYGYENSEINGRIGGRSRYAAADKAAVPLLRIS